MYDDLGFETNSIFLNIASQDVFVRPPEHGAYLVDTLDESSADQPHAPAVEDAYLLGDKPLVLPGENAYVVKPESEDDWLVPLSNGNVTELSEVVVTGRRYTPTTPGSYYNPYDYGGWDGHDTSVTVPPSPTEELPDCVSAAPEGVDEDALMRVLQYLNDEFQGDYNGVSGNDDILTSRYEYGVYVYELNGQIGHGNIYTDRSPDYVNVTTADLPDGARIIAWMHSHPNQPGIDDRIPSSHPGGDWDQYRELVTATLPRGITVDPNLLLALYSHEGKQTRIYDKNDRNTNNASCPVGD